MSNFLYRLQIVDDPTEVCDSGLSFVQFSSNLLQPVAPSKSQIRRDVFVVTVLSSVCLFICLFSSCMRIKSCHNHFTRKGVQGICFVFFFWRLYNQSTGKKQLSQTASFPASHLLPSLEIVIVQTVAARCH